MVLSLHGSRKKIPTSHPQTQRPVSHLTPACPAGASCQISVVVLPQMKQIHECSGWWVGVGGVCVCGGGVGWGGGNDSHTRPQKVSHALMQRLTGTDLTSSCSRSSLAERRRRAGLSRRRLLPPLPLSECGNSAQTLRGVWAELGWAGLGESVFPTLLRPVTALKHSLKQPGDVLARAQLPSTTTTTEVGSPPGLSTSAGGAEPQHVQQDHSRSPLSLPGPKTTFLRFSEDPELERHSRRANQTPLSFLLSLSFSLLQHLPLLKPDIIDLSQSDFSLFIVIAQ